MKTLTPDKPMWYIAHNDIDVHHCGKLEAEQTLTTGQPVLETFESEIAWVARQVELGIPLDDIASA